MRGLLLVLAATVAVVIAAPATAGIDRATSPAASGLAVPRLYKNCTNFQTRYPHGVARLGARDKTSGTPVTTFKRSSTIYRTAMRYNDDLDRDGDGVACEKK